MPFATVFEKEETPPVTEEVAEKQENSVAEVATEIPIPPPTPIPISNWHVG